MFGISLTINTLVILISHIEIQSIFYIFFSSTDDKDKDENLAINQVYIYISNDWFFLKNQKGYNLMFTVKPVHLVLI